MGKKPKKKPSKAKSPVRVAKAPNPAPPARTEQKAETVSPPPPPQAREVTETPEEELVKSQAKEEGRPESSSPPSRYQKSSVCG